MKTKHGILALLVALCLLIGLLPGMALAASEVASGTCGDNLTWVLDSDGVLTISGEGEMNSSPWTTDYAKQIKTAIIEDGVTSIGEWAFSYCTSLTSISIPDSVTSIGDHAFWGCTSLTSITIPDSVTSIGYYAFDGCTSLTSVTIGSGVTSIGWGAFWGCTSLTSVTIPDSVTSIGWIAFSDCTSLTAIEVDPSNAYYSSQDGVLFNKDMTELITCPGGKTGEYTIPDSVTSIGDEAFCYCTSLTSIAIPDSVTSIGGYAFYGCTSLTSVTIGSGVTSIGQDTFFDCTSLTSITIPDSVTSIGQDAFTYCTSLTSVTIPDSVTSIGKRAFSGCTSLTAIEVDPSNAYYSSQDGVLFNKDMTVLITCPGGKTGEYTIPDSVTSIGDEAFYRCTSLTSITIPEGVTSIGGDAFEDCTSLDTILFEGDAPAIGERVFEWVSATAYYPAGNETWTEDVMQDYGGTITWVVYTPGETAEPVVTVTAGEGAPATDVNVPLTSEDITLGGIGVEVSYALNVNAVESVSEEEKALIDAALDGSTAAIYLDVTLNRTVNGNTAAVTETEEMVLITMTIPTELLGENRTYSVIRVHDGEVEILPDLDNDANTVTIQTDRFSTYVLTYSETANEPTAPATSEPEASTPTGDNPKDGDFAPIMTCAVLMLLSAAAVVNIRKRVF